MLRRRESHIRTAESQRSWSKGSLTMAKKKSRDLASDIIDAVREGTKKWTRTVKAAERSPAARAYRISRMTRERGTSIREAAAQIMEAPYLQASGIRRRAANRRQLMDAS